MSAATNGSRLRGAALLGHGHGHRGAASRAAARRPPASGPPAGIVAFAGVLLVVLAVLLACAQAQTTITAERGRFFRQTLDPAPSSPARHRLTVQGYPDVPEWMSFQSEGLVVYGVPPLMAAESQAGPLQLEVVRVQPATPPVLLPLQLSVVASSADFQWTGRLRINNYNLTQILNSSTLFQDLVDALGAVSSGGDPAVLGNTALVLTNLTFGETSARNMPPSFFSPPVPIPNSWKLRTTFVYFSSVSDVPTCAQLRALYEPRLAAAGFTLDPTNTCLVVPAATTSAIVQSDRNLPNTIDWSRSEDDFDATVVPAIVIAIVLLAVVLLWALCSCLCGRRSEGEREQQEEWLVQNRMRRGRMHVMRKENKLGSDQPLLPKEPGDADLPLPTSRYEREETVPVPLPTGDETARVPPPAYRRPPMHQF